jgi:hypothetical protein
MRPYFTPAALAGHKSGESPSGRRDDMEDILLQWAIVLLVIFVLALVILGRGRK